MERTTKLDRVGQGSGKAPEEDTAVEGGCGEEGLAVLGRVDRDALEVAVGLKATPGRQPLDRRDALALGLLGRCGDRCFFGQRFLPFFAALDKEAEVVLLNSFYLS